MRAASETDEAVGDRANDAIRVTGADLRCKVVGEGANLGMTQRGRIEAAQAGIRLNTDAIDNSAGVNTSDVEVNIKVALSPLLHTGALKLEARNALLVEMTDEVARLVLRNNYQQTLALSLAQRRGLEDLGFQSRLMQTLEMKGELDRAVEFLPDEMTLAERRKRSEALTRPELAVLLAYAKLSLYNELLDGPVPDDPYLGRELSRYFPKEIVERFPEALQQHRLRREIIATQLTNSMINRGGATLDRAHRRPDRRQRLGHRRRLCRCAQQLRHGRAQRRNRRARQQSVGRRSARPLRHGAGPAARPAGLGLAPCRSCAGAGNDHRALQGGHRAGRSRARPRAVEAGERCARRPRRRADQAGAPETLARRIASLPILKAAPDIVLVADRAKKPVGEVAATYFATEAFFQLDRVAGAAGNIVVSDYFDRLALDRALDSIGDAERRLTAAMVGNGHRRRRRGRGMGQAAAGRSRAHPFGDPPDRRIGADAVEAIGGGEPARGTWRGSIPPPLRGRKAQCLKCRVPVNTIATLCSSAAAMTLSSLTEPPGWITAVAPASIATSKPSGNGKKASDATTEPLVKGAAASLPSPHLAL